MSYSLMCGPAPDGDGYGWCDVCQRLDCICQPANMWRHRDDPVTVAMDNEAMEAAVMDWLEGER